MCAICDLRIEFNVEHPDSLLVAVATRRAIDHALLPEPAWRHDGSDDIRMRLAAVETLRAVQQRLEQTHSRSDLLALPDFYAVLVESRTWAYFRPTPTGFDPNCRPDPPDLSVSDPGQRDAVLVGSEPALRAIAAGRLPFDRALAEGLLVLDADPARHAPLAASWRKAYPSRGFSRLVCA